MRSVVWRGFPWSRSETDDAAVADAPAGPVDPAVDELLAALAAEPRPHELDGLAEPLAAYRATFATPPLVLATPRRAAVLTGLLSARAAAAVGGVGLGLAATAMVVALSLSASGAERLPVTPAATTPAATSSEEADGVGPDATGPAVKGLCNAWSNHQRNGGGDLASPPMRNLAKAAGGEAKIGAYCATIPRPGNGRGPDKPGKGADDAKGNNGQGPGADKPGKGADKDQDKDKAPKDQREKGADDDDTPAPTTTPSATATPSASPEPSPTSSPKPSTTQSPGTPASTPSPTVPAPATP